MAVQIDVSPSDHGASWVIEELTHTLAALEPQSYTWHLRAHALLARRLFGSAGPEAMLTLGGHSVLVTNITSPHGADYLELAGIDDRFSFLFCMAPASCSAAEADLYRRLREGQPPLSPRAARTAARTVLTVPGPLRRSHDSPRSACAAR